jgi:hypothetical protein
MLLSLAWQNVISFSKQLAKLISSYVPFGVGHFPFIAFISIKHMSSGFTVAKGVERLVRDDRSLISWN